MLLYHYSSKPRNSLKSIKAVGVTAEDKKRLGFDSADNGDPFNYINNVSFFLEPIPRRLGSILHNESKIWSKGKVIFEHVVDIKNIPIDINYRVVESPEKTKLLYIDQDWDVADNETIARYRQEVIDLENNLMLKGTGRDKLVKISSKYIGMLEQLFKDLYKRHKLHPGDKLLEKYAATVVHLMLYPGMTSINVTSVNEIEIL